MNRSISAIYVLRMARKYCYRLRVIRVGKSATLYACYPLSDKAPARTLESDLVSYSYAEHLFSSFM